MATLKETATYIRSKNAGPFWLTLDIFFETEENYQLVKESGKITPSSIAAIYRVKEEEVKIFFLPSLKVIKISFPRKTVQGSQTDSDMHGGQQYVPLLSLEI